MPLRVEGAVRQRLAEGELSPAAGVKLSSRLCTTGGVRRPGALRTTVTELLSEAPCALPVSVRVPFRTAV